MQKFFITPSHDELIHNSLRRDIFRYWRPTRVLGAGILALAVGVSIFPLLVMLDTVVTPMAELAGTQQWIPNAPTMEHIFNTLVNPELRQWLKNSAILALGTTVFTLILAIPASFVLARREFTGRRVFLNTVLITQTMSPVVLIVPMFSLFRQLSLVNTYAGVIIASTAFVLPFTIWLLVGFFRKVSFEMEEAAALDGATGWRFVGRFLIPTSLPGITATGVYAFMYGWNEFIFSLTFLAGDNAKWPITIGIFSNAGLWNVQWQALMMTALVGTLPILILFVALHHQLEEGLGGSTG